MLHVEYSTIPIDILEEIIALGEGYKIEFRESLPPTLQLAKTVCAFSNSKGGTLFVGISNTGETIGIRDKYGDLSRIEGALSLLHPLPPLTVQAVDVKNREIILIKVLEGEEKPYYVRENDGQTAYVRTGDMNVVATKKELRHL